VAHPAPPPEDRPQMNEANRVPANIGQRVAAGAVWAMLYKLVERSLGFVSTLILARVLMPADFGLVAIATSFVAMLELLRMFGFDMALIQLPRITRDHADTAWTFAAVLGLGIATLLLVLAPFIADFYDDQRLKPVLWALSLSAAFNGLESNGPVLLRKELNWRKDFLFQATRKVASVIFTIPLAFIWRNYWALVVGIVAGRFASLVVSFAISPQRPRFCLSARADLWSFSKWVFVNNMLQFLQDRLPNLVMGRLASAASVGYFGIAKDISTIPTLELTAPINRAAFPGYAKIAQNRDRLASAFLKLLGVIAMLALPAGIGVAACADLIVAVFLGHRWAPAVTAVQLLGIYGALRGLQSNANAVYLSIGRPRLQSVMMIVFLSILIPGLFVFTPRFGQDGAALACLLGALVAVPVNLVNVCRCLDIRFTRLLAVLWRPLLASLVMGAAVLALNEILSTRLDWPTVARLAACVVTGGILQTTLVSVFWLVGGRPDGAERWLLEHGRARLSRARNAEQG
jgi:lipopolysaccharide exporter